MAETKHTPGPWLRASLDDEETIQISAPSRRGCVPIAKLSVGFDGPIEVEQQANAHLIAASPDLLALAEAGLGALERELAGLLETSCLLDKDLNPRRDTLDPDMAEEIEALEANVTAARAAIAKATGAT